MSLNEASQEFARQFAENFMHGVLETVQKEAFSEVKKKLEEINIPQLLQEQVTDTAIPYFERQFSDQLRQRIVSLIEEYNINETISNHVVNVMAPKLETDFKKEVTQEIYRRLEEIKLPELVREKIHEAVVGLANAFNFPDGSIPGRAVDPRTLSVSADNITAGLVKNFQSTGIQDSATECQVTILDRATVFENRLVAGGLEVAGNATFKGDVTIEGNLPKGSAFVNQLVDLVIESFNNSYSDGTFDQYVARVFDKIDEQGLDVSSIKVNGQDLVSERTLSGEVINSNLQKVGALKELQVVGETLLDQTLYVSNGRIGINNMDPERALDLWDQEVQIVLGKRKQDTAVIGTARNQDLIISANNRDQLVVGTDGSVSVKSLNIGRSNHTSAGRQPTDNRPIGQIVWNEQPIIGSPVGWVSLGGARWAGFGIITG
jgi:hypothetical protein